MRPTPALIRAGVVSLFAAALALLFGRIDLLVPGLPLLCWAVLARMRRADRGADRGVPEPRLLASNTQIAEGDTVRLAVEGGVDGIEGDTAAASAASVAGDPDQFVTVTCPLPAHADMTPVWGAITDTSRAHLDATVHRWGRYHVGPLHVVLADPFGAHRAETQVDPVHLRVTPDASLLDAPLDIPSPIGVAGLHLSRRRGDGTALADVRPFQLGDRLHRINWPVTSRTGHLHPNATFTEQDTDVLLVTDTLLDVVPPEGPSSLDMTVRATTAVTRYYLGIGDRVGVHDLGGAIGPIRTGSGPRQLRIVTESLSRARRDMDVRGRVRPVGAVRSSTLVVVCSPLLADGVVEQIGLLVARGADVIVVDTLPAAVGDVETLGSQVRAVSGDTTRFWSEAWAVRRLLRGSTIRELREQGVPVTAWEGPASLGPVLLSLAQAGSAPRMRRS
jgi:uncharacterized protein (DUF58 family)